MGTYGISTQEFLDGVLHIYKDEEGNTGFEQFLQSFEGDVSALTVAEAWNKLAKKYDWNDNLKVIDKKTKKEVTE